MQLNVAEAMPVLEAVAQLPFGAATRAPQDLLCKAALQDGPIGIEALTHGLQTELVEPAETWSGQGSRT